MTIEARYSSQATIVETMTGPYVGSNNDIVLDGLNSNTTLNANSSPAATKMTAFQKTLVANAGTINLLTLPGLTVDEVVNCNSLRMQIVKFRNLATNVNTIQIVPGAANPYALLGASFKIILAPGDEVLHKIASNQAQVVNAANCNIDLSGISNTGNQVLEVLMVAG